MVELCGIKGYADECLWSVVQVHPSPILHFIRFIQDKVGETYKAFSVLSSGR